MRLTYWNADREAYEARIYESDGIILRTDGEERLSNGMIVSSARSFISGSIVNTLAEYENTGLTPREIKELQGDTLKKLKESNKILRKNNDEYYVAYQKLLDENRKLKSLLKNWLDSEMRKLRFDIELKDYDEE